MKYVKSIICNKGDVYKRQEVQELIMLLRVILSQNYFTFDNRFFAQDDGLAMGSPCLLYTSPYPKPIRPGLSVCPYLELEVGTVSYTHLDVYKRQLVNSTLST